MSSSPKAWFAAAALLLAGAAFAQSTAYPGIGRPATAKEVAAWDIDVRPDFKGLPKGSGTVAAGMEIWETQCASCHGIFGESNSVFSPLVGGTTAEDIKTGRVARLLDEAFPGRTTMMKVPTVSTLFDYIRRAMPWNAPKTLSDDQVYAVTAYLLNLERVLPDDFTLSDRNIAEVQARMPNRNGMTTDHGMWPGKGMGNGGKPDVQAVACMKDCAGEPQLKSFLPDFARNQHGNLAEQNRIVGAQFGADTTRPPGAAPVPVPVAAPKAAAAGGGDVATMLQKNNCTACHGMDSRIVGPSFVEIARKYDKREDREAYLAGKIVSGGSGVWGAIPMPAQELPPEQVKAIARWLATGAKK